MATLTEILGDGAVVMHYDASGSSVLFTDTAGTAAVASDGQSVKCWRPEPDAALQVNLTETTNAPTYTASDSGSGYKAVTFDGSNDVLSNSSTGLSTGQRVFIAAVFRFIGATNTLWNRGTSAWQRGLCSTTADGLQTSDGILINASGIPTGRRAAVWVARESQTEVNSYGFCVGNRSSGTPVTLNSSFHLGALTGASQFGNFALNEIVLISDDCEWGQVLRAATMLRYKWGITDLSPDPVMAGGGSVIVMEDD